MATMTEKTIHLQNIRAGIDALMEEKERGALRHGVGPVDIEAALTVFNSMCYYEDEAIEAAE